MKLFVALAVAFATVFPAASEYTSKGDVVILTESNFESDVLESDALWMVEFYAPWCGHCKSLEPEWKKAAKQVAGTNVRFGAVDATEHSSLAAKYGVQGYPTIKVFGLDKNKPKDYRSGRSAADLVSSAKSALKAMESESRGEKVRPESPYGDDVVVLSADDFDETISKATKPVLVKFYAPWCGHCKTMVPAWSAAATALKDEAIIASVDATVEQSLAQRFEVSGFPTIKVFLPGESAPSDYDGARTEDAIVSFVQEKLEELGGPAGAFQITDPAEFEERCMKKTICVVAALPHVIDGGAAKRNQYLAVLEQMAGKHKRGYGFAWYAAGEQNGLDEALSVSMYPTLEAVNFAKARHTRHVQAFDLSHVNSWLARPGASSALANPKPKIRARDAWDGEDYVPPQEE
eukprot:TRINITY_DN67528_c0_g1_i1.p1 TRINITY_DN67528_c0_g1~~TRINITY_DN67528_c0_g1_i1.p1  ORF type:complete len:405 (+),score=87.89 TRINITY_DN67528_c0_g1_i1:162-1376(+)